MLNVDSSLSPQSSANLCTDCSRITNRSIGVIDNSWKTFLPFLKSLSFLLLWLGAIGSIQTASFGTAESLSSALLSCIFFVWIIFGRSPFHYTDLISVVHYFQHALVKASQWRWAFLDPIARLVAFLEVRCSRDFIMSGVTFSCVALCLYLDADGSLAGQTKLAFCAWTILIWQLAGESNIVRIQVAIAIGFATVGEHFASPYMGGYTYRFENVPAYVPPGHGMVYLTAVAMARTPFFLRHKRSIATFVLTIGTLWSLYGLILAERGDAVGALLFSVFFVFVFLGRSPLVYLAAFFITTWLEILGTHWGTWRWAVIDPVLSLPQGNPPSGVAAWYCLVDAVALGGSVFVMRWLETLQRRRRRAYKTNNQCVLFTRFLKKTFFIPQNSICEPPIPGAL